MTVTQSLIAFIIAAGLLTMTPGLDTALVLRTAAARGSRAALLAAVGVGLGCLAWGAIVSLGLGALLAASALAFTILKWAGAAYLLWLGIGLVLRPRDAFERGAATPAASPLRQGLLTNLLNPKVGVFYITFLPQFVPAGVGVAGWSFLLACIHVVLGLAWFALLIAATVPLAGWLARGRVIRTLDRLTGGVFIAFGIKLALTRQP